MAPIVIGTRATPLARIQAHLVARRLDELGVDTAVRAMSSQGDRSLGGSFAQAKGVFTGELTAALRDGSVDLVVHSLKDLPVEDEPDLVIAAVPERERPFDLLLFAPDLTTAGEAEAGDTATELATLLDHADDALEARARPAGEAFAPLPAAARLGTSSPRRQAGALALRPDLVCCAVRGSVGRRLEWLQSGAIDALLAAEAGVLRLARSDALAGSSSSAPSAASGWTFAPGPARPVRARWRCRCCAAAGSTDTRRWRRSTILRAAPRPSRSAPCLAGSAAAVSDRSEPGRTRAPPARKGRCCTRSMP